MCLQVVGATFPTSLIVIASFRVSGSGTGCSFLFGSRLFKVGVRRLLEVEW